jgi:hypothetical protein
MFVDVVSTPRDIRVMFKFERPQPVLLELRINVVVTNGQGNTGIKEAHRMIEGARYSKGLCGSCLECDWYQVATLIRRCLDRVGSVRGETVISLSPQDETGPISSFQVDGSADEAISRLENLIRSITTGHGAAHSRPVLTPVLECEQPVGNSTPEASQSQAEPGRRGMILSGPKKKERPLTRAAV